MSKLREALFIVTHPREALVAHVIQNEVGADHRMPPTGSTIEEFPMLPVSEAAIRLREARKAEKALQKSASGMIWSDINEERLKNGERPIGWPEHMDV